MIENYRDLSTLQYPNTKHIKARCHFDPSLIMPLKRKSLFLHKQLCSFDRVLCLNSPSPMPRRQEGQSKTQVSLKKAVGEKKTERPGKARYKTGSNQAKRKKKDPDSGGAQPSPVPPYSRRLYPSVWSVSRHSISYCDRVRRRWRMVNLRKGYQVNKTYI